MTEKTAMLAEDTETTWNYCKFHNGDWIETNTTDKVVMRRYEKYSQKYPEYCKLIKEDQYSMTFMIHPRYMGLFPRAPRKGPVLSEEQKKINSERLGRLRKAKNE